MQITGNQEDLDNTVSAMGYFNFGTPELKPPESCGFCGSALMEWYWVGYDRYSYYAETCNQPECHKWLINKVKRSLNK